MIKRLIIILSFSFLAFSFTQADEFNSTKIEDVQISTPIFNPSKGEKCTISYKLSEDSIVAIKIYDENNCLVRTIVKQKKRKAGVNKEIWDGKNDKGDILPSEAYTFTIEGAGFVYDPLAFSGGERIRSLNATARRKPPYSISYELPVSARVRIRIGVKAGPLYRTLIDWQPRPPGSYTERWDGKDKTGKVNLGSHPFCFISVEAFSLPENSIIISGASPASPKAKKPSEIRERKINTSSKRLYEHAKHPRWKCRDPEMRMILPEGLSSTDKSMPIISGECPIKIEIEEDVLKWLQEEKAEYIFYVDNKFIFEEEQISSPYIWNWDSRKYKNGKHLLTVNIRSFSDHCATDCIWVYVENED
jgi:hypothetical protein